MTAQQEVSAILDRKGWTQYELAKRSGLPRSTIKRIMDGGDALTATLDRIRIAAKSKR
jgi:predicted transcriptional regulator